jgi:DNA-binding XRE family transcriptional regulator
MRTRQRRVHVLKDKGDGRLQGPRFHRQSFKRRIGWPHRAEEEAAAEGSDAVAELQAFRTRYQLARELMEARQLKNLTQEPLAELSGIGQGEISKIESGRSNPTISTLTAITCALETEIHLTPGGDGRIAAS